MLLHIQQTHFITRITCVTSLDWFFRVLLPPLLLFLFELLVLLLLCRWCVCVCVCAELYVNTEYSSIYLLKRNIVHYILLSFSTITCTQLIVSIYSIIQGDGFAVLMIMMLFTRMYVCVCVCRTRHPSCKSHHFRMSSE